MDNKKIKYLEYTRKKNKKMPNKNAVHYVLETLGT